MSKRDEYAAKIKQQIDETNDAIDELEREAAKASDSAEKQYDEQIAKLRQQSDEAKAKLEELQSAAGDKWEKLADEVEHIGKALNSSFNYFKSQF